MPIGRLDQRVMIRKPVYGDDDDGDSAIVGYDNVVEVWAEITGLKRHGGSEVVEGDQLVARETLLVTIRNSQDLSPQHMLSWRGRELQIESIPSANPRDGYLELVCVETKGTAI